MSEQPDNDAGGTSDALRRDRGATFIELLVSIVLLGIGGVAVLVSLLVSIQGSDQHRSKIAALADLESAGSYLTRAAAEDTDAECSQSSESELGVLFNSYLTTAYNAGLLQNPNEEMRRVTVTTVSCALGTAEATLLAVHDRTESTETLNVAVGGISVLKKGDLSSSPPTGGCSWRGVSIDERNPIRKRNGDLRSTVTVTLDYDGDCASRTASLLVTNYSPGGGPFPMTLAGDASGGSFEYTFGTRQFDPWPLGPAELRISTSDGSVFTDFFTVIPQ